MAVTRRSINFDRIKAVALSNSELIMDQWLPGGRREGAEWVSCNPRRADRRPGSFKVNIRTGKWADFADGSRGGDLISLAAYLGDLDQKDAAIAVAEMLRLDPYG